MADQAVVWDEVANRHRRAGSRSATSAMRDAHAERQDDLTRTEELLRSPDDDPVGILALASGRAACAVIFDEAESLRGNWPRLVRSYALEAINEALSPLALESIRRLLQRLLNVQRTAFPSPGIGQDVRINGNGVVSATLLYKDVAVHTALYRRRRKAMISTSIRRPSQLARRIAR